MIADKNKRGSLMLGMAPMIMMLVVFSAMIAQHTVETYQAAGRAERFMQARAAAEGAVVLILQNNGVPDDSLQLGDMSVKFGEARSTGQTQEIPLLVRRETFELNYTAYFIRGADGRLTLASLGRN